MPHPLFIRRPPIARVKKPKYLPVSTTISPGNSTQITMRLVVMTFLKTLFIAPLFLLSAAFARADTPPNFVILLTDDHGWTSTSTVMDDRVANSRSDYHETPAIDRLAREGLRFSNGYAPAALCVPTRRSILFGQTPIRQRGDEGFGERYNPYTKAYLTIPLALKERDPLYRAAHFGKWHLKADPFHPEDFGYDESDGNTSNDYGNIFEHKKDKFTRTFISDDPKRSGHIVDRGISFVRRQVAADRPFFLQLSFYATHVDIQARQETLDRFENKPRGHSHDHPGYAAMLSYLDSNIDRFLDYLDQLGITDNTYVIFLADNGGVEFIPPSSRKLAHPSQNGRPQRNHPLRGGKWVLYEGGIRVPFIIRGPGIPAGVQSDVPVIGYDILPTIAELAGYSEPMPEYVDGGSFVDLLDDGAGHVRRPLPGLVFHRYAGSYLHSAFRMGDLKLVKFWTQNYLRPAGIELYDLNADLGELHDISAERQDKARQLESILDQYIRDLHFDPLVER